MSEVDLPAVKSLVEKLKSHDAFVRRDAIEHLAILTQQRHDFRWNAEQPERRRSVRRWKRWIAKQERERRTGAGKATIQILAGGQVDKAALEEALKGLAPGQKKALMAQLIAKVAAEKAGLTGNPACDACGVRPGTARVTDREEDGSYALLHLCEVCVHRGGG